MNRKFALALLSTPALFASMLSMVMMAQPVHAQQKVTPGESRLSCVQHPESAKPRLVCMRVSNPPNLTPQQPVKSPQAEPSDNTELDFTEEESDLAIAKFGCDCLACINAIRELQGLPQMPV
jgi:hypothetical protein